MTNRINIKTIKIGLLVYVGLVLLFGILYWLIGEIKTNDSSKTTANLFDSIYFSFITFATIGYGDFVPTHYFPKLLIFVETTCAALYTPVFGGYLFYELFKRPKNILFPDNIFLRHVNDNIFLSVRLGNQGIPTTVNKATIEFCYVRRETKWTKEKYEQETPIFENTWFVEFQLNKTENKYLLDALKFVLTKKNEAFVRISFSANDAETGQAIYFYKDYSIDDIKFGERYVNVVTYEGIKKSKTNWANFNKIAPATERQKEEIENILK